MSESVENNCIFSEQKFNIVVTSSNNITPSQLPPSEMAHAQPEQVCIVIADPSQPKQLSNSIPSLPSAISYPNAFVNNLYYIRHDIPSIVSTTPQGTESNISVATPKNEAPILANLPYLPTSLLQTKTAKIIRTQPQLGLQNDLPLSTSSNETIEEKLSDTINPDYRLKNIDKRLKVMEQLMKQSIKINKQTLRSQMRMEHYLQQAMKNPVDQPLFTSSSNRTFHFQRHSNESQAPQLFRYSSQPDNTAILAQVESSSPSDSPPFYPEIQMEDSNSPNLTIDLNCPILIDSVGQRSPHKYHSHSCSMYNKSIREFSDPETIQWMEHILPILGNEVTMEKIQEVLSQTNTITHFTAEFQKVVFTNNERKTLTTSGKFRKRKLERIVLGPLDASKLQGIIQLSLYLFGVTEKDGERVKYQLKQAIDEKNRREFYREDRGTKRMHLSMPN